MGETGFTRLEKVSQDLWMEEPVFCHCRDADLSSLQAVSAQIIAPYTSFWMSVCLPIVFGIPEILIINLSNLLLCYGVTETRLQLQRKNVNKMRPTKDLIWTAPFKASHYLNYYLSQDGDKNRCFSWALWYFLLLSLVKIPISFSLSFQSAGNAIWPTCSLKWRLPLETE